MSVEVMLAGDNFRADICKLLGEYLAELSVYGDVDHAYPYFDAYWTGSDCRWPYFILGDGAIIGFAFVNTISPSGRGTDFSMAEFYVQPHARGSGYGLAAAMELFQKHDGVWELSIMKGNKRAQNFWPKAISAVDGRGAECFENNGETIHRFYI